MKGQMSKRLLILLALGMSLVGFGAALAGLAMAGGGAMSKTLDRDLDPVIIDGTAVSALAGFPVDQLFVYAYTDGVWRQIPAQVDEVTASGVYTTTGDGLLDVNDEIVFMAKDLGDQASPAKPITASLPISPGWYELAATDPISPTKKGWAYLVRSTVLTPTFTTDYVNLDMGLHRVNGATYSLGFATTFLGFDHLALSGSGVDILDRTKFRLDCSFPIRCPKTEELPELRDEGVKDGPVRAIVRARAGERVTSEWTLLAYSAKVSLRTSVDIPRLQGSGSVRFSTDFNEHATGAVYYSAVVTGGMAVDGVTDTVAALPLSLWWQVSTSNGTLIRVADTTPIGGIQSNYYVDRLEWDGSDTGDRRHYGDTGISIDDPKRSFTYLSSIYFLPDTQPNVGATYGAFFAHPLSATALLYGDPRPEKVFLPVVMKNATAQLK